MRSNLVRWLITSGVAGATLVPAVSAAQPDVRGHRHGEDERPREAPPAPKQERFAARAGFLWIPGRWEWHKHHWNWLDGHWERERAGKKWREPRWEARGDTWELVDGEWIDIDV